MVDKKLLKIYLIGLIISAIPVFIIPTITNISDATMQYNLYTIPFSEIGWQQAIFFNLIAFLVPYLMIFLGYVLAFIVVLIYTRLTKLSKRIEFVGYANTDRSGHYLRRRYIIQIFFATLLATNVWISLVTNPAVMVFFLTEEAQGIMYSESGAMYNFPMIALYWVPLVVVVPIIAMCAVMQDSGLVSIKKLSGQSEFADTERIGDKLFGLVKGYAGISVIISFFMLIQSPMGGELSLVLYPLLAMIMLLHLIIAIDLFRNMGRKLIFKAAKRVYPPQIIEMSYDKKDIADFKDL